ncbi:MAG: MFS transporter [Bacillota bacterium]
MNHVNLIKQYNLKGNYKTGLTMATFGFFVGFAAVSLYGPVAASFDEVMKMPSLMLGFLIAAPSLAGSLLRIPFGAWVDTVGGKKPFLILFALSIIGMAGLTSMLYFFYPDQLTLKMYPLIFLFGLLSGCGIATFSVGVPQTSYWYPQQKQGFALGVYGGLGNIAPGIFGILLPFALITLGLTGSYATWFLFLIAGTLIYAAFAQDAYYFQLLKQGIDKNKAKEVAAELGQELFPSGTVVEALKTSAKIPGTWGLVALYFTSFGGFLALTAWFPTYWIQFHGIDVIKAGLLMAFGFSILASLIRVYGGILSDKFGGESTAIISFLVMLIGAGVLSFTSNFNLALIGEIILGAGMGTANAAVFKLVPKYVPSAPGGAGGWVGGLGAFGGFVIPPLLGVFVDNYGSAGYAKGFLVFFALAIIAIVIAFALKSKYGKEF